jgi:hypothetical protein
LGTFGLDSLHFVPLIPLLPSPADQENTPNGEEHSEDPDSNERFLEDDHPKREESTTDDELDPWTKKPPHPPTFP